jgi:hypothetical protein
MKMSKISNLLLTILIYSSGFAQDTVSSGFYKQVLPKTYNKNVIEEKCIEKARINAIENAFGFVVVDSSSLSKIHERINDEEISKSKFNSQTTIIITGRWLRDESPPVIDYQIENGITWISVSVRGIVREIKPKNFNDDIETLAEYLKELYFRAQFEGVKIVENDVQSYFISLVALEKFKYKNYSDLNTVARVKAQSQASKFINGATISSENFIFTTSDGTKAESVTRIVESINEISIGFINGLQLLTSFDSQDGTYAILIFFKKMDND